MEPIHGHSIFPRYCVARRNRSEVCYKSSGSRPTVPSSTTFRVHELTPPKSTTSMFFSKTILSVVGITLVASLGVAAGETHTITFQNNCGKGTVSLRMVCHFSDSPKFFHIFSLSCSGTARSFPRVNHLPNMAGPSLQLLGLLLLTVVPTATIVL